MFTVLAILAVIGVIYYLVHHNQTVKTWLAGEEPGVRDALKTEEEKIKKFFDDLKK